MKVDMNGDFEVATTPDETFNFITTPETFAPILPYFKELRAVEDDSFIVVLEVGVPQIRGQAEVRAQQVEAVEPERVVYDITGRHGLGMIDARMTFDIAPTDEGARVVWTSKGTVSGTLASLAQGILLPLAKRQIASLVASVQKELGVPESAKKNSGLLKRSATAGRGLFGARKRSAEKEQSS